MKKIFLSAAIAFVAVAANAQNTVMVGGEAMYPKKNIVENAVNSKDHTTLVAAVKAAGLVETLSTAGANFTVFAPVNDAFENLPAGTVETLLKPENKGLLTTVLTYHVLGEKKTAANIIADIKKGGGKVKYKTVAGKTLTAKMNGPMNVVLEDENGVIANILTYDVIQSNGVIHVIDHVVTPKM